MPHEFEIEIHYGSKLYNFHNEDNLKYDDPVLQKDCKLLRNSCKYQYRIHHHQNILHHFLHNQYNCYQLDCVHGLRGDH